MGLDDDADCVEHVWQLREVIADLTGARMVHTCERCGAVDYEPSAQDLTRPGP